MCLVVLHTLQLWQACSGSACACAEAGLTRTCGVTGCPWCSSCCGCGGGGGGGCRCCCSIGGGGSGSGSGMPVLGSRHAGRPSRPVTRCVDSLVTCNQLSCSQQEVRPRCRANIALWYVPSGRCARPPGRPLGDDAELRELRDAGGDGEPPVLLCPPCNAQQRAQRQATS